MIGPVVSSPRDPPGLVSLYMVPTCYSNTHGLKLVEDAADEFGFGGGGEGRVNGKLGTTSLGPPPHKRVRIGDTWMRTAKCADVLSGPWLEMCGCP